MSATEYIIREIEEDDDDSSSSNGDELEFATDNEPVSNDGEFEDDADEEEEVLETFGQNPQVKRTVFRVKKPNSSQQHVLNSEVAALIQPESSPASPSKSALSLVDAIGRAVAAVEIDKLEFEQSTWTPLVDNTGKSDKISAAPSTSVISNIGDIRGDTNGEKLRAIKHFNNVIMIVMINLNHP